MPTFDPGNKKTNKKSMFKPTWLINSVYSITPNMLKDLNIKGAIVDIDNTLIPWDQEEYSSQMAAWINEMLEEGIKLCLVSNNTTERVSKVAEPIGVKYFANALKPSRRAVRKTLDYFNLPKEEVVIIGDQVLTDVLVANRAGIRSILVKSCSKTDIIFSRINRFIERFIFKIVGINPDEDWGDELARE